MEARLLLATITVTGTGDTIADDGVLTLREAIMAANANALRPRRRRPPDRIEFNIPGAGVRTINATDAFPTITAP